MCVVHCPSLPPGQNERIGDRIHSIGWGLKMLIGQKGDHPNVNFRWVVVSIPKSYIEYFFGSRVLLRSITVLRELQRVLDQVTHVFDLAEKRDVVV